MSTWGNRSVAKGAGRVGGRRIGGSPGGFALPGNLQEALDAAGMLPGFGAFADGANTAIYPVEGKAGMALLSPASAVPGIGDAVGAAKITGVLRAGAVGLKNLDTGADSIGAAKSAGSLKVPRAGVDGEPIKSWESNTSPSLKKKGQQHIQTNESTSDFQKKLEDRGFDSSQTSSGATQLANQKTGVSYTVKPQSKTGPPTAYRNDGTGQTHKIRLEQPR